MKTKILNSLCLSFSLLLATCFSAHSQSVNIAKGTSLYIEQESESKLKDSVPDLRPELQKQLENWGHFTVVSNSNEADLKLDLQVQYVKDGYFQSASLFNRRAAIMEANLLDSSGKSVWESGEFKVGERGMIGYNFGKEALKKLVKKMKKDIK